MASEHPGSGGSGVVWTQPLVGSQVSCVQASSSIRS
jgi:hypothetical protein